MTRRVFDDETQLTGRPVLGDENEWCEEPHDGLLPMDVILYDTGRAVAAALAAGLILGMLCQAAGLR